MTGPRPEPGARVSGSRTDRLAMLEVVVALHRSPTLASPDVADRDERSRANIYWSVVAIGPKGVRPHNE